MTRHRPRLIAAALLALAACTPAAPSAGPAPAAAPIAAALDSIFGDSAFASAQWGVLVRSLDTGETLYRRNAGKMFVPASNTKIVTAAAALEALGPDYRYRTRVAASGPVANGELKGNLLVIGSGDPTISERFAGDVRTVFRAWADSLRARGITRIDGYVLGVDDVFDDVPLGRGWAWDDLEAYYSAEVSGLELNEGIVDVRVEPAAPGQQPRVIVSPPTEFVPLANLATTGAAGTGDRIRIERTSTGSGLVIQGSIAADTALETSVAIRNNTAFFAAVLHETLMQAGILVTGRSGDADDFDPSNTANHTVLFTHTSPPLAEILEDFMKPSQNQIGEILLKTLGAELRGEGSARAGVAAVDSLARAWGLPARLLAMADGSGLSRYNLVAPEFLVALLERESRGAHAAVFTESLPVAGVDGTLSGRMRGTPAQGNLRAKTGTLSGVRSLSGYFTTAAGERMVFSMLVNHHTLSARDADRLAEAAVMRLIALPRTRTAR
ncbi:MAG TPA: D-alanyl-D-alanine carboxypeptidase/D-alanyl-D-alanine-endopeptidase [Longimicrobium sp.]|nr:D-alanyl-D-alanine carboxypeptidase/D-alanyl-D-alanine-endopeptidase [Longimicrobium sp.]